MIAKRTASCIPVVPSQVSSNTSCNVYTIRLLTALRSQWRFGLAYRHAAATAPSCNPGNETPPCPACIMTQTFPTCITVVFILSLSLSGTFYPCLGPIYWLTSALPLQHTLNSVDRFQPVAVLYSVVTAIAAEALLYPDSSFTDFTC